MLTDRFARDGGDNTPCDTGKKQYCGGTWRAMIDRLDYIQGMGFDAVWISPIVENIEDDTDYGQAYHGYWTKDFYKLNPHFGTEKDLMDLSKALHDRNMFLMVDVVVNHVGAATDPPDYTSYNPFNSRSQYHPQCWVQDYTNQTEVEVCWLGDSKVSLVDVNTEDEGVVRELNSWIGELVKKYDVDGIRIDTLKHVRKDFWPEFAKSAGVWTVGEVLSDNVTYTADWSRVIDAVLDYPTWFQLTSAFKATNGSVASLAGVVTQAQHTFDGGEACTGSFLENHDQPRFASLTKDMALIKNAMAWPFINDGVPILYYGQEQGYEGAGDPDNRESLWNVNYDTSHPLVSHVTTLNKARKAAIAHNDGFVKTPVKFIQQPDPNAALAVSKPPFLTLLTNVGSKGSTTWQIGGTFAAPVIGELVDVFTCRGYRTSEDGHLKVESEGGMPMVMLEKGALDRDGSICPEVFYGSGAAATMARRPGGMGVLAASACLLLLTSWV